MVITWYLHQRHHQVKKINLPIWQNTCKNKAHQSRVYIVFSSNYNEIVNMVNIKPNKHQCVSNKLKVLLCLRIVVDSWCCSFKACWGMLTWGMELKIDECLRGREGVTKTLLHCNMGWSVTHIQDYESKYLDFCFIDFDHSQSFLNPSFSNPLNVRMWSKKCTSVRPLMQ